MTGVAIDPVCLMEVANGMATLTFTVPTDRVGEWEIGCFSEAGDHYVKGMRGKVVVVR